MQVREIMKTDIKTIPRDASIQEAANLMSQSNIGCLIVVEDHRMVGIITERDILKKVVAHGLNVSETAVEKVMTGEIITIEPDTDIKDAAEIMHEKKIKKLPIVKNRSLIGIVTAMDLCAVEPHIAEKLSKMLLLPKKRGVVAG